MVTVPAPAQPGCFGTSPSCKGLPELFVDETSTERSALFIADMEEHRVPVDIRTRIAAGTIKIFYFGSRRIECHIHERTLSIDGKACSPLRRKNGATIPGA